MMNVFGAWTVLGFAAVALSAPTGVATSDGLTANEVLRLEEAARTVISGEPLPSGCNTCWDAFNHNVGYAHAFSGGQPLTPPGYYIVANYYLFEEPFDLEAEVGVPLGHSNWVSGRCNWYHESCFPIGDLQDAVAALVERDDPSALKEMIAEYPAKMVVSSVSGFILFGCNGANGMVRLPAEAWASLLSA